MIITAKHLATAPKRLRGLTVRGLAKADNAIDPTGGNFGAGIIRGFAVITRGEALGHGFWIDTKFVRQTRMAPLFFPYCGLGIRYGSQVMGERLAGRNGSSAAGDQPPLR